MNLPSLFSDNSLNFGGRKNPMLQLQSQIDRMFDEFRRASMIADMPAFETFLPSFELEEAGDHYVLSVDLPGMKKEDIRIEAKDNQIVISGERKEKMEDRKKGNRHSERRYGYFQRSFTIPEGVKPEQIVADYKDGVLQVAIPRSTEQQSKEIKIGESKPGFFDRLLGKNKGDSGTQVEEKRGEEKTEAKKSGKVA